MNTSTPGSSEPLPDAGWYHDPTEVGWLRLWDGAQWTEQRKPNFPGAVPATADRPTTSNDWGKRCEWRRTRVVLSLAVIGSMFVGTGIWAAGRPDPDAVTFCQRVPQRWGEFSSLYVRVPDTTDFDQLIPYIMDGMSGSEFLLQRQRIDPDGRGGEVREAAWRLLGALRGEETPITGDELRQEMQRAVQSWGRLSVACGDHVEMPCLPVGPFDAPTDLGNGSQAFCV